MKKFQPSDLIGKRVRLHSAKWSQGWCDGEVVDYEPQTQVWWFRPSHSTRQDDPLIGVRQASQFTLI